MIMKRKRLVPGRKICERKKRLSDFVSRLRKRFHELEKEEEEFRSFKKDSSFIRTIILKNSE
jgi:hypothetical protein